jgi:thiol:disulfide interchange protein DsbD
MRTGWWLTGVMAVAAAATTAAAQPGEMEHAHARPRLVSEVAALEPGKTGSIAVTFEIDPHWHLYWKGQNDSGFAPRIEVTTSPALHVGEPRWPAPRRNILPGNILDHIYENRVTLIIPVEVPADATGAATFRASCEWLVCMESCVPGSADLTLTVPIGGPEAGTPGPEAPLFAAARARTPVPLPATDPPVRVEFRDGVFIITSTAAATRRMAFYPAEDGVKLSDAIADGATDTGALHLHLAEFPMTARLAGVLDLNPPRKGETVAPQGAPTLFWVDLPIAAAGAAPAQSPPHAHAPPAGPESSH